MEKQLNMIFLCIVKDKYITDYKKAAINHGSHPGGGKCDRLQEKNSSASVPGQARHGPCSCRGRPMFPTFVHDHQT